jgi:transposase
LHTRKFFCDAPSCCRRIFTERLPDTAAPYARRTLRLNEALRLIGLVVGGAAGARLAERLGMVASGETLLRHVRQLAFDAQPTPRVLGVDDWAWKRGHRYGTILCDLERHTVVDLLPDRTAEGFAAWLRQRLGVEIITRDRAGVYADGARQGAPAAVQVADRWHLLRNLAAALEGILRTRHGSLREAARTVVAASSSAVQADAPGVVPPDPRPRNRAEQVRHERRERRLARYYEVVALHEQGASQAAISRQLGLGRHTVRRWLRAGQFPEWTVPPRPSELRPFLPYLEKRWAEGCRNAARLWRELRQQGYTGQDGLVRQWVGLWKRQLPGERQHAATRCATPPPTPAMPTLRRTAWLLLRADAQKLTAGDLAFVSAVCGHCPELEQAAATAREFVRLVRERDAGAWPAWLERARTTPLARFAEHLQRDEAAVVAALQMPWSNGQVEGQVHRLKLVKRQAYGRAKFDLLRQRVLHKVA